MYELSIFIYLYIAAYINSLTSVDSHSKTNSFYPEVVMFFKVSKVLSEFSASVQIIANSIKKGPNPFCPCTDPELPQQNTENESKVYS